LSPYACVWFICSRFVFVNTVAYGRSMKAKHDARIGRDEWIREALKLLLAEGIAGVRVEPLALRLKVTKGSFYWHFKDRAALHAAMLEHWRRIATRAIAERVDQAGGTPRAKLRRLIGFGTSGVAPGTLETAMRGWARHDATVAAAIAAADDERIAYVSGLLRALGIKPGVADVRARILYLALIGSYFSQVPTGRALWREIETLVS
jgi:AcrR family transcriptional regulator